MIKIILKKTNMNYQKKTLQHITEVFLFPKQQSMNMTPKTD